MNLALTLLIVLGAVVLVLAAWTTLRPDPVGRGATKPLPGQGFQTLAQHWLLTTRPTRVKAPRKVQDFQRLDLGHPWLRALNTLVHQRAVQTQSDLAAAYTQLRRDHATSPLASAFLDVDIPRAVRAHGRARFRGPAVLFPLWFHAILRVRHGRQHLAIDALAAAIKELRTA